MYFRRLKNIALFFLVISNIHAMENPSHSNTSETPKTPQEIPYANQPATKEVWEQADKLYWREYISKFKSIGCFKFKDSDNQQNFYELLATVAQNPAGRILLYRLLVELHRDSDRQDASLGRNDLKTLVVIKTNKWSYNSMPTAGESNPYLNIGFNFPLDLIHINPRGSIEPQPDEISIDLFHELLHWFHSLVNLKEYSKCEESGYFAKSLSNYFDLGTIEPSDKPKGYIWMFKEWGAKIDFVHEENKAYNNNIMIDNPYSEDFDTRNNNYRDRVKRAFGFYTFVMEELFTVLGPKEIDANDNNGSELSENLYRAFGGYGLRVQYCVNGTHEDRPETKKWFNLIKKKMQSNLDKALTALNMHDYLKSHLGDIDKRKENK